MINTMDFKKQKYFLQNSKVYDQKIGKISFKKIRKRITISIIFILLALILICLSFISPWWTAHYQLEEESSFLKVHRSRDFIVDFHLTKIIIEETDDKGHFIHSPYERAETDFINIFEMIFFIIITLIFLLAFLLIFLFRFGQTFKNFYLTLVLFIPIIILSILIISIFAINNLWGKIKIDNNNESLKITYHPNIGFYLFLFSLIIIAISLVILLSIGVSTLKSNIFREYQPKKMKLNLPYLVGLLLMLIAFILLFSSLKTPWWSCKYSEDGLHRISSADFGWGPDTAYVIAEQDDVNKLSPFDGYIYAEESVYSKEFFGGDFEENENITYEKEKEVVKNTTLLLYIPIFLTLISIISGFYFLSNKKINGWLLIICFLSAMTIIFPLVYFSIELPIANQEDMREPYIKSGYPIPPYSQAALIKGFFGEKEIIVQNPPLVEEFQAPPEVNDYSSEFNIKAHYCWGPATGYFQCIFAFILEIIGISFIIFSIRKHDYHSKAAYTKNPNRVEKRYSNTGNMININKLVSLFVISFFILTYFSPIVYADFNEKFYLRDIDCIGPFKRYKPITSVGGEFKENLLWQNNVILNLENGEKNIIYNFNSHEIIDECFNGEIIVWQDPYDSLKVIHMYNLTSKSFGIVDLFHDYNFNIEGITEKWMLLRIYNETSESTFYLYYFNTKDFVKVPMEINGNIEWMTNEFIITEDFFDEYGNDYYRINFYDLKMNITEVISPPEDGFRLMKVVEYINFILLFWYAWEESGNKNVIIVFYNIDENKIEESLFWDNMDNLIHTGDGLIISSDKNLQYFDLKERNIETWSLSFIFNSIFFFYDIIHYNNDTIYFWVCEFKKEDLFYHFSAHVTGNLYVVYSGADSLLWEFDLNTDSDSDGQLDIHDIDDDNDGIEDYFDKYPYDPLNQEIEYDSPEYNYTPPPELLFLIILLIITGITILWRLRKIK